MKEISLTQGKVAFVDDDDFGWINQWAWYAHKDHHTYYALCHQRKKTENRLFRMHRLIMAVNGGYIEQLMPKVDHVDRDGLNNQKHNLRLVNNSQNACNSRLNCKNTSGHRGVYWHKSNKKWDARIRVNGKRICLGEFKDVIDGAKAYDEAARKYHGEFAQLNFPEDV